LQLSHGGEALERGRGGGERGKGSGRGGIRELPVCPKLAIELAQT
jgi:hypothetical protein